MRITRIASTFVLCLVAGCAVSTTKDTPRGADYGTESAALAASPTPIGAGQHHRVRFDATTRSYAFALEGTAGTSVSIYADGVNGLDTVLYLYKVSRTTGRPYGKPIASNDDTSRAGWTDNEYSSSIDSFVLPETRSYAMVVKTYNARANGFADAWFDLDLPAGGPPPFGKDGAGETRQWKDVTATTIPISDEASQLATQSQGSFLFVLSRAQVDPADAAAILADSAKLGTFLYDVMYYANTNAPGPTLGYHGPANWKAIASADAVSTLESATRASNGNNVDPNVLRGEELLVGSMLGDGDFAGGAVRVFKTDWNNGDDTNSDGIVVVDAATGEVRGVTLVNPP